jgi:acetyl esterase/lipase
MTIFISILVALLLLISIWIIRNRAADHSEYDSPVSPLMKDAADVSSQHQTVVEKLNVFHQQAGKGIEAQRKQMDEFFTGAIDATVIPTDVNGIPGEWVLAAGADPDRRLLYLHGGGFRVGSPRSHRYLTRFSKSMAISKAS